MLDASLSDTSGECEHSSTGAKGPFRYLSDSMPSGLTPAMSWDHRITISCWVHATALLWPNLLLLFEDLTDVTSISTAVVDFVFPQVDVIFSRIHGSS